LFGESLAIREFPLRPDIAVLDMSGWEEFGQRVARRLGYINTYFHKEPYLDISVPPPSWNGRFDVVISSDVFEHVAPPVARAFENTLALLKPGGSFLLTVPYRKDGHTQEHFPDLYQYELFEKQGSWQMLNTTKGGERQCFNNLIFHGGPGSTLEMRVFSEAGVRHELETAGYIDIQFHGGPAFDDGVVWSEDWSLPITARKPLERKALPPR
jgi:SAM-dependent methyltransferase